MAIKPIRRVQQTAGGTFALGVAAALLCLALLAPLVWGERAEEVDIAALRQGPSSTHWFGTDELGRDVFARVMVATRTSLSLAVIAALSGALIGGCLGGVTVLLKPRQQRWVTNVNNVLLAMPGLLLAMFLATVIGVGATGAVIAIAVAFSPFFIRLSQTLAASVGKADYLSAARLAGVSRARLLRRHVLLNVAEPLIINTSLAISSALLALAGLSFLGLGVQAPAYDWGQMLNSALDRIYADPVVALAPAGMIVLAGLAFNLLGESLSHLASGRDSRSRKVASRQEAAALLRPTDGVAAAAVRTREDPVVRVRGLRVRYPSADGPVQAVREFSVDVGRGETVGIVGESGSGKSQAALAIAQLIEAPGIVDADELLVDGLDLGRLSPAVVAQPLGMSLAMVFQDPMSSFNPALRMGTQLTESSVVHLGISRREALARAVDRLGHVRISRPKDRVAQYPHELSGGMRQRAMIAMGLMGSPKIIAADEPTTALDVTVQRGILELLEQINQESKVAILLISHDIAVVARLCDRVLVMYAGRVVEDIDVKHLVPDAAHPYTRALIASVPDMTTDRSRPLASIPGRPPEPVEVGTGCAFAPRCPLADQHCQQARPPLATLPGGQLVACWKPQLSGDRAEARRPLTDATS